MSGFLRLQVGRMGLGPSFNKRLALHLDDVEVETRTEGLSKEERTNQIGSRIGELRASSYMHHVVLRSWTQFCYVRKWMIVRVQKHISNTLQRQLY